MPVLNWIGKDKVVNHDQDLPFRVLKPVKELSIGDDNENLLIQGDNLEALKALMPFYYNKVKCIYIDPPYNTGNEKWIYNDKVNSPQIKAWLNKVVGAEGEDLCRHDKWLCMMYPRLKLLKDLLREDGGIFVSIDYNEEFNLRYLLDEIFGEKNYRNTFVVSRVKKNIQERERVKALNFGYNSVVFYAKSDLCLVNPPTRHHKKEERWHAFDAPGVRPTMEYEVFGHKPPAGRHWMYEKSKAEEMIARGSLAPHPKTGKPRYKLEASNVTLLDTNWTDIQESSSKWGFPNGEKNVELIKRIINMFCNNQDIILDSFAGSGTTAQAVLELNKVDRGNRKFVLVELENNIAKNVTAKRLKKVIEGTGGGFEYLDLNGILYDYSGYVNPNAKYEDMAAYIYFTETNNYLDLSTIKNPYIGSKRSTHYFLFFKGKGDNTLDKESLKKTNDYKGVKVIYADKCLIDEEELIKLGVTFKQIPYELKKY